MHLMRYLICICSGLASRSGRMGPKPCGIKVSFCPSNGIETQICQNFEIVYVLSIMNIVVSKLL